MAPSPLHSLQPGLTHWRLPHKLQTGPRHCLFPSWLHLLEEVTGGAQSGPGATPVRYIGAKLFCCSLRVRHPKMLPLRLQQGRK